MVFKPRAVLLFPRKKLSILLCMVFASFVLRFGLKYAAGLDHDPWTYRFFPIEIGIFLLGSASYKVYDQHVKNLDLSRYKYMIFGAAYSFWIVAPYVPHFKPIFYPIVTAMMIPFVFNLSKRNASDRKIGELSYPVYICHWPIMLVFDSLGYFGASGPIRQLIMLPTVIAIAYCIYRFFEEPIERARQRLIATRLQTNES
jgi:peptidoglycan/LPS O-acetylase OafA/YrhL